jgi:D-3-phosphoglycerate dehydrogenase
MQMAKFRIVTPAGASFTVAGGGYDLEMEALQGMDAEIVEAPMDTAGFIAAAQDADAIYAKGINITAEIIAG